MRHGFASPGGGFVGVAEGTWIGDLVLIGHRWSDYAERMRVAMAPGTPSVWICGMWQATHWLPVLPSLW